MDSAHKANTKLNNTVKAHVEASSQNTSASHSAPQQAKSNASPWLLKRRKRKAPAGW
ncbi:MAG: hypothetical protein ACK41T_09280 [Pseudobdellovibrio sp.]